MRKFRKAIIIIHGFAGGIYDQEFLTHRLELVENFDVFTFTLPGHDGDFNQKITADSWIKRAEDEVEFVLKNGYKEIYVVGHSMGGVIATHIASKYSQVKKLVLVAPAFRVMGFASSSFDLDSAIHSVADILEQYGSQVIASRMIKLPASCLNEFAKLVKNSQGLAEKITIPTLLIRGTADSIVPEEAIKYAYEKINTPYKKIVLLNETTHDVFKEDKKGQVSNLIVDFLKDTKKLRKFPEVIVDNDKE